jgi:tetratricopeptide (TPR) repeat protein
MRHYAPVSHPARTSRFWLVPAIIGVIACAALVIWQPWRKGEKPSATAPTAAPLSEAQQLVKRAGAIWWENGNDKTSDTLAAAEELYTRALALDPADAEAWAEAARLDAWMVFMHFDQSEARRQKAQKEASSAVSLAPNSFAARHAQACVLAFVYGSTAKRNEAEKTYRVLVTENPNDKFLAEEFGIVLRDNGRTDEAAALFEKYGFLHEAGWNYTVAGRWNEANKVADRLLSQKRTFGALYLKAFIARVGFEDLDAAKAAVSQFTQAELMSDEGAYIALLVFMCRREFDEAIRLLNEFPRDVYPSWGGFGFKKLTLGEVYEMTGRLEAASAAWQVALAQVQERLKARPNDPTLLGDEAYLIACIGDATEAGRVYQIYQDFKAPDPSFDYTEARILMRLGRKEEVLAKTSQFLHERRAGWETVHATARFMPMYDPLRGDPRFEKLLRDTLSKYAKPFDEPADKAAPAPESGR